MTKIMNSHARAQIDEWLSQQMEEAAAYAYPAGLYGLPDEYRGIVEAKVRSKATELYGEPGVDPEELRGRQVQLKQRCQVLRDKVWANPVWKDMAGAFASDVCGALPGWRVACVVPLLFALWGVARRERTWDGWAVLVLGAALAVLLLPVLPVLVRFAARLAISLTISLRHAGALLLTEHKIARLEAAMHAQRDLRRRLDEWAEQKLGMLVAEYQHNKNIALMARLVS